jgi:integrase
MGKMDKKELPKGIYKRGGVFWIRYAGIDGKIIFESAKQGDRPGTKQQDAEALLHERKADVGRGKQPEIRKKIPNVTFKALSVEYLKWAKRQRSFKQKETLVNQLVTIFGAYPLRAFNSRLLEQYQTERMEKSNKQVKYQVGNKAGTINRHIATIKHMFTKGVEWELVEEDALKKVRKVKMLEENNRRLRYLSVEECGKLLKECPKHLRPIVITALHTGMRRGEILGLKWENVDLKHGFILLDKTKNGTRREIPVDGTLRATLTALPRRLDLPYVFFNPDTGLPYGDIKTGFNRACRKAGIKDFHFHDLRHTFASHLVMAGQDITTVKELLGHKSLTMTLRYAHLAPAHAVKAVELLDSILNETPTIQKLDNLEKNTVSEIGEKWRRE